MQLKDICCAQSSNIALKDLKHNSGPYPIYGASGFITCVDFFKIDKPYVGVVKDGAGVGRVMLLPEKSSVIGTMQSIIPAAGTDAKYLSYLLDFLDLGRFCSGATIPHIYFKDYGKEPISAHSPEQQQEISAALDKITKLIALRQGQLSKLDQLAKSRFIEMFGDPGSGESKWEKGNLGDYIEIIGGYAFKSEFFADNGIPVLRIGNINTGEFVNKNMVFWQEDVALSRYLVFPGDMVISLTGTVGKDDYGNICIVNDAFPRYYLNQRNAKLCIKKSFSVCFIAELMRFPIIKQQLTNINRGVRQANIANKDIAKLVIPISPLSLQNEFAVFVEQLDKSKVIYNKTYNVVEKLQIVV